VKTVKPLPIIRFITPVFCFCLITFFFRTYQWQTLFSYTHDQDLLSWFVKDVVSGQFRLLGQETSTQGIFIGPYFYYLMVPFYLLWHMDPLGGMFALGFIAAFATWSLWYIFSDLFSKEAGYLAAFFHSTSYFLAINERELVPTQPIVLLWTVWYLWSLHKIVKQDWRGFAVIGLLFGLIWHINIGLVLLSPLFLVALLWNRRVPSKKSLIAFSCFLLFGLAPLFLFELRHSFSQTHAFFGSLQSDQRDVYTGWLKVEHTLSLTFKNIANLFHGGIVQIPFFWSFLFLFICFLFLVIHRKVSTFTVVLFSLSVILTVGFFAQYSKILSEYYLNGIQFVWFSIFVLTVSALLSKKIFQNVGIVFIILFSFLNVIRFVQYPVNASGYTQRRAIISEIKEDMALHNYPCFSISYITSP
jgi:4-amino-4-deoxy-L-arabinose transferase-like glycosyltransferase